MKYEEPIMEIIILEQDDVICTSGGLTNGGEGDGGSGNFGGLF